MLVIRSEQMKVLEAAALRAFETRMVEHCFAFQPRLCKTLGEERVRMVVHGGIGRAADFGFTNRGPARLYLDLMLLFGSEFATDPQYPWASEVLGAGGADDQMQRAKILYERTIGYQQQVAGPDNAYTLAALTKLPTLVGNPLPFTSDDFVPGMLWALGDLFPQKIAFVGHQALEQLIREAIESARSHGLPTARGFALMVVLMFAFGHGCGTDPLYPWIGQTLTEPTITDPAARASCLEQKLLTWLDYRLGRKTEVRA